MRSSAIALLALIPLVASTVEASPPCGGIPCPAPIPRATHFIAEVHAGSTTFGGGGLAIGGTFGVGGKLRGFPPIFYLVGEAAFVSSSESGYIASSKESYRDQRDALDLLVGPRVYLPIFGPVRLFAEVLLGTSKVDARLRRDGAETYSLSDWTLLTRIGLGIQVRVLPYLSVGGRFVLSVAESGISPYTNTLEHVGVDAAMRSAATASLTYHF